MTTFLSSGILIYRRAKWASETSENAAQIARFIGHAKPNGIEASGMKTIYAALPVTTIQPAKNQANPKRNRNSRSLKPLFPLSKVLSILSNL